MENYRGFDWSNFIRNSLYNDLRNNRTSRIERDIDIISDITRDYSQNMRDYNSNMRSIIHLIETVAINQSTASNRSRRTRNDSTARNNLFMSFFSNLPAAAATGTIDSNLPLTREEIARSTVTYGFIPEENDVGSNVCPISLEPFQEGDVICEIRGCRHKFRRPLLMDWLRRDSRCPVCRYELRNRVDDNSQVESTNDEEAPSEPIIPEVGETDEHAAAEESRNSRTNQLSTAISNILHSFIQNQTANIDGSGNLLYEFQFPLR
jgi:hypothetical protein